MTLMIFLITNKRCFSTILHNCLLVSIKYIVKQAKYTILIKYKSFKHYFYLHLHNYQNIAVFIYVPNHKKKKKCLVDVVVH